MTSTRPLRLAMEPVAFEGPQHRGRASKRSPYWILGGLVLVLSVTLFAAGAIRGLGTGSGLIAAPLLLALWLPFVRHESRIDRGFDAAGLLFLAFAVKILSAFGRIYMVDGIYDGGGDSTEYHEWGRALSRSYRGLDFSVDPERPVPGTGFVRILTGAIYTVTGADKFTGFLVFSMFGLLGSYFLFLAFATAVPTGHLARYAKLVFFWPTVVFWPSSIGKEAWMLMGIGLGAWGATRVISRRRGGYLITALGMSVMFAVRPHIAMLVLAAAVVGAVINAVFRSGDDRRPLGFMSKFATIAVLVVAGAVLLPQVSSFLNVDSVDEGGLDQALEFTLQQTSQGGSEFTPADVGSVAGYPWAVVTVMFRPFPWEARNFQTIISAGEGLMLFGLLFVSLRRLRRLPVEIIRRPYVAAATGYILMFSYVFAFIANFGILARQRSQLLPFVFVLVALPLSGRVKRRAEPVRGPRFPTLEAVGDGAGSESGRWGAMNVVTTPLPPPSNPR